MSERVKSLRAKLRQTKTLKLESENTQMFPEQSTPVTILPKKTVSYFKVDSSDSDSSSDSSNSSDDDNNKRKKNQGCRGKIKEEPEIDPLDFFNIPELQIKIVPTNPIEKEPEIIKPQTLTPAKQIALTEEEHNDADNELFANNNETVPNNTTSPVGINMLQFMKSQVKLTTSITDSSNGTPKKSDSNSNSPSPNNLLGSLVRSDKKILQSLVKEVQENPQQAEELDLPILNGQQRNKLLKRMKCARHSFSLVRKLNQGGLIINEKIYEKIEELRRCPNFNSEETIQKIISSISLPTYIIHDPDVLRINEDEDEEMPSFPEVKLNFSAFKLMK